LIRKKVLETILEKENWDNLVLPVVQNEQGLGFIEKRIKEIAKLRNGGVSNSTKNNSSKKVTEKHWLTR